MNWREDINIQFNILQNHHLNEKTSPELKENVDNTIAGEGLASRIYKDHFQLNCKLQIQIFLKE